MSFWSATRLVAARELRERSRSKSFKVSSAVTLVLVVLFIVVPGLLPDGGDPEWDLAVTGPTPDGFEPSLRAAATSVDGTVTIIRTPDGADPAQLLEGDDAPDAVLVDGEELVAEGEAPADLRTVVAVALSQSRLQELATDEGIAPDQLQGALGGGLETRTLDGGDDDGAGVAFLGIIVLFIAINTYGAWVLTGVLEEKSSRVVELIVAAIPPRALLTGKVLGIGALGLAQLAVIAIGGVAIALTFDIADLPDGLLAGAGWALVWFVLGFAFFAVAYAAAGSLVTRQEDAQTAATPIVMVVLACYFISLFVVAPDPDSTAAQIVSIVPPIAPIAMPSRIAVGAAEPWEIALSMALMVAATWALVTAAARIYAHALLRTGAPLQLGEAWRGARAERTAG